MGAGAIPIKVCFAPKGAMTFITINRRAKCHIVADPVPVVLVKNPIGNMMRAELSWGACAPSARKESSQNSGPKFCAIPITKLPKRLTKIEMIERIKLDVGGGLHLPPGISEIDIVYPRNLDGDRMEYRFGCDGCLTFYRTKKFGWCLAILPMGPRLRGQSIWTHAIKCTDEKLVRIGHGSHIRKVITAYVRTSRVEALKKYTDLYIKGTARTNAIHGKLSKRVYGPRLPGMISRH